MRLMRSMGVVVVIAALTFVLVPKAGANEWDQKTILTFNQSVEVPGVVLPAGTYVFKVLNVMGTRDVIQVLNRHEDNVCATFIALPAEKATPSDRTDIRFAERPAGLPPAIEA